MVLNPTSSLNPNARIEDVPSFRRFQALRDRAGDLPFVSRSTRVGSRDRPVLNLAERAAGGVRNTSSGTVATSIDRGYRTTFHKAVDLIDEHATTPVRDKAILAREPGTELTQVGQGSALLRVGQGPPMP